MTVKISGLETKTFSNCNIVLIIGPLLQERNARDSGKVPLGVPSQNVNKAAE